MKAQSFIRKGFFILTALCLSKGFNRVWTMTITTFLFHTITPMRLSL